MQCLSDFNVRLARAVDLGPDVGSLQVEQTAAHVLESSAIFLDLVNSFQRSGRRDNKTQGASRHRQLQRGNTQSLLAVAGLDSHGSHESGNRDNGMDNNSSNNHDSCVEDGEEVAAAVLAAPFTPDVATVLQLVVFSMRLTELHHDLYSAIYRYLQDEHLQHTAEETNASFSLSNAAGPLFPLLASLTIAGVVLTPHPRFQLELVLQAGAHYLGRSKLNSVMIFYPLIQPQHKHTHTRAHTRTHPHSDELTSVYRIRSSRRPERTQGASA